MAIDNTPPRLKLIVTIAILVVVTLIGLDFVFKSYYGYMSDQAARGKLAPTTDLDDQKKAEAAALAGAQVPLDKAMGDMARGARSEIITPAQSEDLGPMQGWAKLPKPAPTAVTMPGENDADGGAVAGDGGAAATDGGVVGDGGANAAGDGGASNATDAGAPRRRDRDGGAPRH